MESSLRDRATSGLRLIETPRPLYRSSSPTSLSLLFRVCITHSLYIQSTRICKECHYIEKHAVRTLSCIQVFHYSGSCFISTSRGFSESIRTQIPIDEVILQDSHTISSEHRTKCQHHFFAVLPTAGLHVNITERRYFGINVSVTALLLSYRADVTRRSC